MRPTAGRSPNLRVMLAGADSDTRALVEGEVQQALGPRLESEAWTVSLVRVAGRWSVTLDGPLPHQRHLSFSADEGRLGDAIREALGPAAPATAAAVDGGAAVTARPTAVAAASSGEVRVSHVCESCGQTLVVVYERQPDDAMVLAAVACPHCWEMNRVEIGAWAASGRDYRAEKG